MLIRYQVLHPDSKMILKKSQMLYHVRVNTMILLISVKMNLRPVFKSEIHPTQNLPSPKIHFTPKVPRSEVSPYYKLISPRKSLRSKIYPYFRFIHHPKYLKNSLPKIYPHLKFIASQKSFDPKLTLISDSFHPKNPSIQNLPSS